MYTLLNGVERNAEFPDTFEIPDESERNNCTSKNYVKLCFQEPDMPAERMWVKVETREVVGDKIVYTGKLDNDPFVMKSVKCGDAVTFNPEHILSIMD